MDIHEPPPAPQKKTYRFTIDQDGTIVSELVNNATRSRQLEACVAEAVANVTFDERPEGGPVTYEFRVAFSSGGKPEE